MEDKKTPRAELGWQLYLLEDEMSTIKKKTIILLILIVIGIILAFIVFSGSNNVHNPLDNGQGDNILNTILN